MAGTTARRVIDVARNRLELRGFGINDDGVQPLLLMRSRIKPLTNAIGYARG